MINPLPSIRIIPFVCLTVFLSAEQFTPAAQNEFSNAEADGIKTFLQDNFRQTNACMVVGLVDKRGSRIFSAGTANDLLKYLSAQIGVTPSSLTTLMEKTHVIRFKDSRGHPDFGHLGRTARRSFPNRRRLRRACRRA